MNEPLHRETTMRIDCRKRPLYCARQEAGLCVRCGEPRNLSAAYCDRHLLAERLRMRKAASCKPRKVGGRGRPPLGGER